MEIWIKIKSALESGNRVAFLYVLESMGSSPGRQGFKMMVSQDNSLFGSVGGGVMEYNLVEFCKEMIQKKQDAPILKRQVHRKNTEASSGLICSGEQTIGIYFLENKAIPLITNIIHSIQNKTFGVLIASEKGINFLPKKSLSEKFITKISKDKWHVQEDLGYYPVLHIIGGGHVSQALAKFAPNLGFKVIVYDDRDNLNTFSENAEIQPISNYENIGKHIPQGNRHYVVVMSFGYQSDLIIIQNLLPFEYKYLGLMGSKNKIRMLKKELITQQIPNLEKLHAPIGIQINSQTPTEIAISILGEMIGVKNRNQ